MPRLVIIPEPELAPGFRLAGVEVFTPTDYEGTRAKLLDLIGDESVGLIAVSGAILERLDPETRRKVDSNYKPVVVSLPAATLGAGLLSRRDHLMSMIRRAIGFHITFAGEEQEKSI
ncbi:MAG TPA: V-type ATP synthase subunit F [Blastocatellia bacterium]|nr:V-type ATP synthase subunit F [Blastocatellia bacterium]